MSWSVNAMGRAGAVSLKVATDLAKTKCAEPEETIKNSIGAVITKALGAYPDSYAVSVEASGSQGPAYTPAGAPAVGMVNSLTVSIKPLYGFVE